MYNDNSVVRVKRWFKKFTARDKNGYPVTYKVDLDWDLGEVDNSGLFIAGSPYQIYSEMHGDPVSDAKVIIQEEELPVSNPFDAESPRDLPDGVLHFKHPNI